MKFVPKEDIRSRGRTYEANSPLDSVKQGIPDETIERWYANGWTEIEGRDPAPDRQVRRGVKLQPRSVRQDQKEVKRG